MLIKFFLNFVLTFNISFLALGKNTCRFFIPYILNLITFNFQYLNGLPKKAHNLLRITGGKDTNIIKAPYMLQLLRDRKFYCAAVLITSKKAVSAAQCARNSNTFTVFQVLAGSGQMYDYFLATYENPIPVKFYKHPNYCEGNCKDRTLLVDNDIAVLILSKPLKFSKFVHSIPLPQPNAPIPVGKMGKILGWGYKHPDIQIRSDYLQSAMVKIIDQDKCKKTWHAQKVVITDNFFCAGMKRGTDHCPEDIGGPIVVDNVLYGIISFGDPKCGSGKLPGVYTNVAKYIDFIKNKYKAVVF